MFRLHPLFVLDTIDERTCLLSSAEKTIELRTEPEKLSTLVRRLTTTGFQPKDFFRLLDQNHHPSWGQETLWNQLHEFLTEDPKLDQTPISRFGKKELFPGEVGRYGQEQLWARHQQVLHINSLSSSIMAALPLLVRSGFEAFVSHDSKTVSTADLGTLLRTSHLGSSITEAVRSELAQISSHVVFASADVLAEQPMHSNHHVLISWNHDEELPALLGRAFASGLRVLPIIGGHQSILVGPILDGSAVHLCLGCFEVWFREILGGETNGSSHGVLHSQLHGSAGAINVFCEELASQWFLRHHVGTLPVEEHSVFSSTALLSAASAHQIPLHLPARIVSGECC